MADLYHLEDEIDTAPEPQVLSSGGEGEYEEWEEHDEIELAPALEEAVRRKQQQRDGMTWDDNDDDDDDDDARIEKMTGDDVDEWLETTTTKGSLEELPYSRLYQAWSQEIASPELLPLDIETLNATLDMLSDDESDATSYYNETSVDTARNANMDALFQSLRRMDVERVKFLLADLLRVRLHKIQAHPWHMLRNESLRQRMSDPEIAFLEEYHAAVERHLATTVTDHFPQEVWKQLDAPDMIDAPDLDGQFVFVRCLDDIVLDDGTDADMPHRQVHARGDCRIVRYAKIRDTFLRGQVELL